MDGNRQSRRKQSGHAVVEVALLAPWIFFLFAGIFDCGWYASAIISSQNAVRVAVLHTSSTGTSAADSTAACRYALAEMKALPNARGLSTCGALPVSVSAVYLAGPDGAPASRVSVTYQTDQLIPIPGLAGRLTITRSAQMRIKDPLL